MKNSLWTTLGASALVSTLIACGGEGSLPTPPDETPIEEPPAPNPGTGGEAPAPSPGGEDPNPVDPEMKEVEVRFRVNNFRQGDIIALPAGVSAWIYNSGEEPLTVVQITDLVVFENGEHAPLVAKLLVPVKQRLSDLEPYIRLKVEFSKERGSIRRAGEATPTELDTNVPPLDTNLYVKDIFIRERAVLDFDMEKSLVKEDEKLQFLPNLNVKF
ncbi:cupin domain-containing protein [Myxococcus fulvus]|uniref:cupin domain-containing protein n=1 Tax=Myxococcus fulvus TaxID=33 RepID=UPI003B9BF0D7